MDAPLPGIGPWDEILKSPLLWHFNFRGPDMERLVAGRERIYLDRFWNELSADPEGDRRGDARALRRALRAAGRHALRPSSSSPPSTRTPIDNKAFVAKGKLTMPVLAIGAEKSFGTDQADVMRFVASDVTGQVIAELRPLADGRAAGGDMAAIAAFSEVVPDSMSADGPRVSLELVRWLAARP